MRKRPSTNWLYIFLVVQCVSVALLAVEALGGLRLVLRILPFGLSLAYLVMLPPGGNRHPVGPIAAAGLAVMAIGLIHPEANTLLSGLAQIGLTLAVWAPVYWTGRITITPELCRRAFFLLWAFNTVSAGFGVLQIYNPGRFAPDPAFVKEIYGAMADGLKIKLDDGTEVFRPMGLSDTPGGAALAANSAIVMGIGVTLLTRSVLLKCVVAVGGAVGMFCLFICQVRSLLILTIISAVCMLLILVARGNIRSAVQISLIGICGTVAGFAWSISVGQSVVLGRLDTLFVDSPDEVYYSNRGFIVEHAILVALPNYPFGAGLGRWGMMSLYFGDPNLSNSPPLWAEITLIGWVYDGGVPLVLIGYAAILVAFTFALRVSLTHRDPQLSAIAGVVAALNVATFATTLSTHIFVAQGGMMYWLLNAMLFAAVSTRQTAVKS